MDRGLPLLLGALGCLSIAGCLRPASAPPQNTPVTIRLDALLSLHPAWSDVRELEVLIAHTAHLATAPGNVTSGGLPLAELPLAPPLPVSGRDNTLASRPPSLGGVTREAEVRLNRLRESIDAHAVRIIDRERREAMEKVAAEVTAKRADLMSAASAAPLEAALSDADRKELRRLRFLEIAYESQVASLLPPARGEAVAKLADVRKSIGVIEAKAPKPAEALQTKVQQQVDEFRRQRIAAMEGDLSRREAQLRAETGARLEPYRRRISQQVGLPPAPSIAGGATAGVTAPRIASPAEVAAFDKKAEAALPAAEALSRLKDQRATLVRAITDELRTRLLAIAAERHWTVSFAARAGYIDVTDRAASALRSELEGETASAGKP